MTDSSNLAEASINIYEITSIVIRSKCRQMVPMHLPSPSLADETFNLDDKDRTGQDRPIQYSDNSVFTSKSRTAALFSIGTSRYTATMLARALRTAAPARQCLKQQQQFARPAFAQVSISYHKLHLASDDVFLTYTSRSADML